MRYFGWAVEVGPPPMDRIHFCGDGALLGHWMPSALRLTSAVDIEMSLFSRAWHISIIIERILDYKRQAQ